jgi:hypothetical protein
MDMKFQKAGASMHADLEVPMKKRLIIGIVLLLAAIVVYFLGFTEITFSIRDDSLSTATIFPAAGLALLGIAQIIKVVRFRRNW